MFHFNSANQGESWLLFDVGGLNSSSQTFRVCSPSGPSVGGRNANGTKSNRIALTHLTLHPKVNWPIWTNVSITRWLFHKCWERHLLFKSAFITALNCWTIWPISHLNNCFSSNWNRKLLVNKALPVATNQSGFQNPSGEQAADGKQKGCATWHWCWLCFYSEVAHLMAALPPKSSPIEQHSWCKEKPSQELTALITAHMKVLKLVDVFKIQTATAGNIWCLEMKRACISCF